MSVWTLALHPLTDWRRDQYLTTCSTIGKTLPDEWTDATSRHCIATKQPCIPLPEHWSWQLFTASQQCQTDSMIHWILEPLNQTSYWRGSWTKKQKILKVLSWPSNPCGLLDRVNILSQWSQMLPGLLRFSNIFWLCFGFPASPSFLIFLLQKRSLWRRVYKPWRWSPAGWKSDQDRSAIWAKWQNPEQRPQWWPCRMNYVDPTLNITRKIWQTKRKWWKPIHGSGSVSCGRNSSSMLGQGPFLMESSWFTMLTVSLHNVDTWTAEYFQYILLLFQTTRISCFSFQLAIQLAISVAAMQKALYRATSQFHLGSALLKT